MKLVFFTCACSLDFNDKILHPDSYKKTRHIINLEDGLTGSQGFIKKKYFFNGLKTIGFLSYHDWVIQTKIFWKGNFFHRPLFFFPGCIS